MSAYLYKNLIIIDRNCKDDKIKRLLALKGWGFPAPKPFEYRSSTDKVVLCYSTLVTKEKGEQAGIPLPYNVESLQQEGAIHLLCDDMNIKVSGCLFPVMAHAAKHLGVLKSYLEHSISKSPSETVLTLHWSPHLVNTSTRTILTQSGLLTDVANLLHKIRKPPPSSSLGATFGFGGVQPTLNSGFSTPSTSFNSGFTQSSASNLGSMSSSFLSGPFWK